MISRTFPALSHNKLILTNIFLKFWLVLVLRREWLTRTSCFPPGLMRHNKKWGREAPGPAPMGWPKDGLPGQLMSYWMHLLDLVIN